MKYIIKSPWLSGFILNAIFIIVVILAHNISTHIRIGIDEYSVDCKDLNGSPIGHILLSLLGLAILSIIIMTLVSFVIAFIFHIKKKKEMSEKFAKFLVSYIVSFVITIPLFCVFSTTQAWYREMDKYCTKNYWEFRV